EYGDDEAPEWPFVVGRFEIDPDGAVESLSEDDDPHAGEAVEQAVRDYWRGGGAANEVGPSGAVEQVPGTTVELAAGALAAPRSARGEEKAKDDVSRVGALRSFNKGATERTEKRLAAPRYRGLSDERVAGVSDDQMEALLAPRYGEGTAGGAGREPRPDAG